MKAKLLISVLLLTLLSVMTVSCDFSGSGSSDKSGYIWSSYLAPVIIKPASDEDEERKELYEALSLAIYDLLGKHTCIFFVIAPFDTEQDQKSALDAG